LVPAFILVLAGGLLAILGRETGWKTALPADLDFSTSFASTLTAVQALLGTVIAASVLPEQTTTLSQAAFIALNLIFGAGVVVAGLVYAALQVPKWTDVDPPAGQQVTRQRVQMEGTVTGFLIASFVTIWAVFGELWTMWLLFDELSQDQGFSATALLVVKIMIGISAVTVAVYTVTRIPSIVDSERDKDGQPATNQLGPSQVPSRTVAPARSISLL
jgi:hypothetical protein